MKNRNVIIRNGLALLLCNMALFCTVGRAGSATGKYSNYEYSVSGGLSFGSPWVVMTVTYTGDHLDGASPYAVVSGCSLVSFSGTSVGNVSAKTYVKSGATYTVGVNMTGKPVGVYYLKFGPTVLDAIYWDGETAENLVDVYCDLTIANSTGAVNPDGWVEIDGARYGPASAGGLSQRISLGWLVPGHVIDIAYGDGVTGSPSGYTVPNSPGQQVSFAVNAATKDGPKSNVFKYKFNFINTSSERSCQVMLMGTGAQWTISPQQDGDPVVRKEGTASVAAGTMVSLVAPIYWTISGAPVPHQVFYNANGMDTSWVTESPITLQYTGPSYRSISVKLRIVDHTNSGGKKVTVMRNDEALLDGLSAAQNTTNSNWSGQVSDGETIWLITSEPGMVVTTAPTNGVVSADNTDFEYVVVFYGDGGPPVDPPEPPVNPPEPPVNPPEPPVNPPEPPPEPPEPPEPPVVDPPPPPVDPPEPPTEDPGSDVLEVINNLQKALIADGDATRKLTAEGFNKVLAELHNGTITNAEGLRRVVEAVQNNEYAVREEAYKTRVVNADGFNKMIAAINANGFDDSRIVGAVNEVRDEVKKINDRFDEAEEKSSENKQKFEEGGQAVREAADAFGNSVGEILNNLSVDTSGDVSSVTPVDYVQVGKHKITFNPFSSILKDTSMATTLRACRKLVTWAIVVGLFIEVAVKITVLLADLMKTGSKSSVGGQILSPGLGGTAGVVLGTALAASGLVVLMAVVLTLPVLALAIYTSGAVHVPIGEVISSSPITILNEAAANNPKIAHALWYADQIIPVALCVFAPAYRLLLVHVIIPGKFVAQVLFRFFPF